MLSAFESSVRRFPERTCFTYVNVSEEEQAFSYRETRLMAASLANLLQKRGVNRGDCVAVDLPNRPACVLLLLAAAYGGFSLVLLNNRLTASEKLSRLLEIRRASGQGARLTVDGENVDALMGEATALLVGDAGAATRTSFVARGDLTAVESRTAKALGRAQSGKEARRRRGDMARQDALEAAIHFAERGARLFSREARAVVMFTSGTTGRPKAVPLTWGNLCQAAEASNAALNRPAEGLWQAALPLYHVGGLQVVVRSLLNRNPFILYGRFDARRLLEDAKHRGATHVSVVDKMLQDLLATGRTGTLQRYECILLGGGALNPATVERVQRAHLRVFASYGMTETSSQIANALVGEGFDGGMRLLPGCEARVADPAPDGFGRLAVRGPGVVDGYLNARAVRTVDGFFLTGDVAALRGGLLYIKERTDDMFVSGGENVYPAEIREKLLRAPGVRDAYVFGARDEVWGRRPVAFVERAPAPAGSAQAFAHAVDESLSLTLSKLYRPRHVLVMDEFPRLGVGKVDRAALERCYEQRIEVRKVTLYRIRLPFKKPFRTPKGTLKSRESVLVEVTDHAGRTGLGECVAFATDWYLPETIDQDVAALRDVLGPYVLGEVFAHPREAAPAFAELEGAAGLPLARGALEPALWDLYGKIVGRPLWRLLADELGVQASGGPVEAGAVVGLGTPAQVAEAVRRCAEAGYSRVKLKVAPGNALACVRAARAAAPDAMITLDANQSFTERDMRELRALDECGAAWIEEPLDLGPRAGATGAGSGAGFARLSRLQRGLRTPVCLDESFSGPDELARALTYPELRCYAVKVGKLGGVQPTLEFLRMARGRGLTVWMGGMFDTGVSRRVGAAFQALPGVDAPGDIGATGRYFDVDVCDPPYEAPGGRVVLNPPGHEVGLGCDLNREALAKVLVEKIEL